MEFSLKDAVGLLYKSARKAELTAEEHEKLKVASELLYRYILQQADKERPQETEEK